jgi:hypothetical protein
MVESIEDYLAEAAHHFRKDNIAAGRKSLHKAKNRQRRLYPEIPSGTVWELIVKEMKERYNIELDFSDKS